MTANLISRIAKNISCCSCWRASSLTLTFSFITAEDLGGMKFWILQGDIFAFFDLWFLDTIRLLKPRIGCLLSQMRKIFIQLDFYSSLLCMHMQSFYYTYPCTWSAVRIPTPFTFITHCFLNHHIPQRFDKCRTDQIKWKRRSRVQNQRTTFIFVSVDFNEIFYCRKNSTIQTKTSKEFHA